MVASTSRISNSYRQCASHNATRSKVAIASTSLVEFPANATSRLIGLKVLRIAATRSMPMVDKVKV